MPALEHVSKDDLIWADLRSEQRVIAIKSGLFAVLTTDGAAEEVFSVYGAGYCCGLCELYIDDFHSTYYLKALTVGTVCSFPASAFRHRLDSLPSRESNRIISYALTNWSSASFGLLKLYSHPRKDKRLALLLGYLRAQSGRICSPLSTIKLSHDELSALIRSDRASVTRALHKLEDEGIVSCGYKCVTLADDFDERIKDYADLNLRYHHLSSTAQE